MGMSFAVAVQISFKDANKNKSVVGRRSLQT